jgi:hypothetical protein
MWIGDGLEEAWVALKARASASARVVRTVISVATAGVMTVTVACTTGSASRSAGPQRDTQAAQGSRPTSAPTTTIATPTEAAIDPRTILVWVAPRLPEGLASAVARQPGVERTVAVTGGTAWMTSSSSSTGLQIERLPHGYAIPIEVAGADPAAYAALMPPEVGARFARLVEPGQGLASDVELRLRRASVGSTMAFGSHRIRIADTVAAPLIGVYELFVPRATAAGLGVVTPRYLIVKPSPDASIGAVEAAIRKLIPSSTPSIVATVGHVPYLRDSPHTLPALFEKVAMGEFAGRLGDGGTIHVDPAWVRAHIATATVPIIGNVTCNVAFLPQLREALTRVERAGLASSIHPSGYAGCFVPRFVSRDPTRLISHHAWGSAVDLNAPENPFGAKPTMDRRIVAIFTSLGFKWGGDWLIPDGMHFEYLTAPPAG